MTNCEFCNHINDTFPDVSYNNEHPYNKRDRCKVSGLIIKKCEIKGRCAKFDPSESGKQKMDKMKEEREAEALDNEKYWYDKYTLGKETPPEYRKKFESGYIPAQIKNSGGGNE